MNKIKVIKKMQELSIENRSYMIRNSSNEQEGILGDETDGTYYNGDPIHVGDMIRSALCDNNGNIIRQSMGYSYVVKNLEFSWIMGLHGCGIPVMGACCNDKSWKVFDYVKWYDVTKRNDVWIKFEFDI